EARTEPGVNDALRESAQRALEAFEAGMDDDLNTSVALAAIHNLTREVNTALARHQLREDNKRELLDLIRRFDTVLNVFGEDQRDMLDSEIQTLIDERQEARRRRDYARADESREQLAHAGTMREATHEGRDWKQQRVGR